MQAAAQVSDAKRETAKNLYLGDMPEEFIAMQLDLDIPTVIRILKEAGVYP
ncbi:hypothetical protein [Nitrososphaera sp.]|uniref:hypothetical protein n=1 Tax=Nitrososphaera sp. TaxID=1971748 RepID=UPI0017E14053|nr:hypothetical protein [Nitrososphaera sp.]NWG37116.1 hypothetical protein [Nitrososphaera sp.]